MKNLPSSPMFNRTLGRVVFGGKRSYLEFLRTPKKSFKTYTKPALAQPIKQAPKPIIKSGSSIKPEATQKIQKDEAKPAEVKQTAAPTLEPTPKSTGVSKDAKEAFPKNVFKQSLDDQPTYDNALFLEDGPKNVDWTTSYHGIGTTELSQAQIDILLQPLDPDDIEMKPDGIVYLPEIKYRRILNKAFGPGGWGMIPRSDTVVAPTLITREYALVVKGRLISVARGEQQYFNEKGIPTATEGCKSNALMRCCKDLGIGSELWDPRFIRKFKKKYCEEVFVTHVGTLKKRKIWKRKDDPVEYPYKL